MTNRNDIEFLSNGSTCRGWLFESANKEKRPCVILAHGFGGVKEIRLDAYAERFADAGYHALVFDYRHFGDSDGDPRQILDIKKQHQDWRAAVAYARFLPEVDTMRIVIWGTSFSGGHVLAVAAEDKDIAAVISQVPHMDGIASALAAVPVQGARLGFAALRDIVNMLLGSGPYYVPSFGKPGDLAAMNAEGEFEASRKLFPKEGQINETVAARIFLSLGQFSPGKLAARVSVPLLVQVALRDVTTPPGPAIIAAQKTPRG